MSQMHVDGLIALVAARQDGLVTRDQLRALGLGRGAIDHRRRRGLLVAVHEGVYRWGPPIDSPWAVSRAAVLACGRATFASHHAGLELWGMRRRAPGPVDVTVVGRRVRHHGIRTHSADSLDPADARLVRGVPLVAPARTLVDVAGELTPRQLADALEQGQIKRLVTRGELLAAIERAPRRPGLAALRALAEEPAFTRSEAERRLVALLRAARLPSPAFNGRADGFEVDVLWRPQRVVLEFDSYAFHATRAAFERDRRRTAALTRARYVVLRTTWQELTREPHALVARTAEALALGGLGVPRASRGPGG